MEMIACAALQAHGLKLERRPAERAWRICSSSGYVDVSDGMLFAGELDYKIVEMITDLIKDDVNGHSEINWEMVVDCAGTEQEDG
jgi:hypothetical protein